MSSKQNQIGYKDIFRQKEYMKIMLASLINRFGDSIDAIASTWIVYELTQNAAWSAIIYGINKVPTIIVTPLAGAWVEGRKKKTIMIVTDIIRAVCVAFVATGYLLGFLQAWMLVLTTFIISTAEAFRGPANTALTPKVLKREYYEYGMSLSSTLADAVELIGTAMAAGIIALIGTSGAIYVDMITFLLSAFIIGFVNTKEQNLVKQKFNRKEYVASLSEGVSYVKKDRIIFFFLVASIFLNTILVPLNSLEAPFVSEVLGGGAEALSILGIAVTAGMLLGSATYPMAQKIMNGRIISFLGAFGIAMFYIVLPACQPIYKNRIFMYAFLIVFSVLLGYTVALLNIHMNVFEIKRIKEEYLARVTGIEIAAATAAIPVASFLISGLVAYISTAALFIAMGVLALAAAVIMLRSKVFDETEEDKKTVSENTEMDQMEQAL